MTSLKKIPEGQYTTTIYGLINEGKYVEVVALLQRELEDFQGNRAALSLLGYSFYMLQNYAGAASWYVSHTYLADPHHHLLMKN
jgi:hypothetical protein